MIVLVCGGRRFANRPLLNATLDYYRPTTIVAGGARGADAMAADWAKANGVPIIEHFPDWHGHGPAAGPLRNQRMLAECPDLVVAFPGVKGTADMVRRARKAGVEVVTVGVTE